jgi:hypothetical protein
MPTITRLMSSTALALVLSLSATGRTDAGGMPPPPPPNDWVKIKALASTDVVQFIQALPHDPQMLGGHAAHVRTKAYGPAFTPTRFSSLDGTPLAGRLASHPGALRRPGVVLVHGFRQTKDRKFVVELAELFARNGWHVLAIDLRGHGESRPLSPAPITHGWKEAEDMGDRLVWTLPRVAGGKTTAGPFVAVVDVSGLKAGPLPAAASVTPGTALVQDVTLQKE